jgi:DNA-binding NarL/FixJ family response regulator
LRVIVADHHTMFRQGLKLLLAREGLEVVAEVEKSSNLKEVAATDPCDVLLLNLKMDKCSADQISKLSRKTAVIVLTSDDNVEIGLKALRLGARAVVTKRLGIEALMMAIRTVANKLVWVPPAMQAALIEQDKTAARKKLTRRESEIVRKVAKGLRNAEVAAGLSISEATVKAHMYNIFKKLGIRDRIELVHYALSAGLVTSFDKPAQVRPRMRHESAQQRQIVQLKGVPRPPSKPDNRAAVAGFASNRRPVFTD